MPEVGNFQTELLFQVHILKFRRQILGRFLAQKLTPNGQYMIKLYEADTKWSNIRNMT